MRVLISCALLIAIPREAGADGAGVIAISSTDGGQAAAAALAQAMIGRSTRILEDAVGEARAAHTAGAVPVQTMQQFKRVSQQVDLGWRAYQRVAIEQSRDLLVAARTDAERLVALPGGSEIYADAALRLGAVLAQLGRRDEAHVVIALALGLDPDRPISKLEFSPAVLAAVDEARSAPVALQRVRIITSPKGAFVRIDGKELGASPLDVQITRGQHLVVARAPGYRPAVQGIPVDAPAVEVQLEPDEEGARLAAGAEPGMPELAAQQLVDAVVRYADLDEVVLVADTFRRGGPTLLVQRCSGAPARCSAVVELGYGDRAGLASAARSAWQSVIAGDLRYPPTVLGDRGDRGDDGKCKWCRSPLFWGGIGAAVVVGTIITVIATTSSRPTPIVEVDGGGFHQPPR